MSQYPECKHGHGDPNSECQQCNADDRIAELEATIKALQKEINEWEHGSNFHYVRDGECC